MYCAGCTVLDDCAGLYWTGCTGLCCQYCIICMYSMCRCCLSKVLYYMYAVYVQYCTIQHRISRCRRSLAVSVVGGRQVSGASHACSRRAGREDDGGEGESADARDVLWMLMFCYFDFFLVCFLWMYVFLVLPYFVFPWGKGKIRCAPCWGGTWGEEEEEEEEERKKGRKGERGMERKGREKRKKKGEKKGKKGKKEKKGKTRGKKAFLKSWTCLVL